RLAEEAGAGTLAVELFLGFVAGIEPAGGNQPVARRIVKRGAVRLADQEVGLDAEPRQVNLYAVGKLAGGTREIGIVHAQHISAAVATGEEPVQQRRACIAQMDTAGRRWRPANSDTHPTVRS